mgnify:CR=1 FL=1
MHISLWDEAIVIYPINMRVFESYSLHHSHPILGEKVNFSLTYKCIYIQALNTLDGFDAFALMNDGPLFV